MRREVTLLAAAVVGIGALAAIPAQPARAAAVLTNCAGLQAALTASATGDVITLHDSAPCTGTFGLPAHAITLQGQTRADGFDGQNTNRPLAGVDVGATVITNLSFLNGSTPNSGGAIKITGASSPTISNSLFTHDKAQAAGAIDLSSVSGAVTVTGNTFGGAGSLPNAAINGTPGALFVDAGANVVISGNTFTGNVAVVGVNGFGGGGAVFAIARGSASLTFSNNVLTGNDAGGGSGGGATLQGNAITVTGNTFRGNILEAAAPSGSPENFGGGLAIVGQAGGTVTQSHNLFAGNTVHAATLLPGKGASPFDFGGGGEWVQAATITSASDTFTGNHVDAGLGGAQAVGGGLGVQGIDASNGATLTAADLAASTNSVGGAGEGGGIYAGFSAGCTAGPCVTHMLLADSTVDANSVGAGGSGAGVAADPTLDVTVVDNSIVFGNSGSTAQIVSGTLTVGFSDSCISAGSAYSGSGNVCTDPLLVDPAANNLHESANSPTLNKGSNALIPAGLTVDFDGDPRINQSVVDMGADEFEIPVPLTGADVSGGSLAGLALASVGLGLLASGARPRRRRRRTRATITR